MFPWPPLGIMEIVESAPPHHTLNAVVDRKCAIYLVGNDLNTTSRYYPLIFRLVRVTAKRVAAALLLLPLPLGAL